MAYFYLCHNYEHYTAHAMVNTHYWAKIKRLPNTDILHKCLKIQENIAVYAKKSWYDKVIHIINESQILDYDNLEPEKLASKI